MLGVVRSTNTDRRHARYRLSGELAGAPALGTHVGINYSVVPIDTAVSEQVTISRYRIYFVP